MDTWAFDDQIWRRSPGNRFALASYRGLEAAPTGHAAHELAALVGAHECREEGADVLYPGPFRYSPATGRPLPALPAPAARQTWLPPFGNGPAMSCLGLRQSPLALALPAGPRSGDAPDTELPLPPPGEHHFLVGHCKTRLPLLLAFNPRQGLVYLHTSGGWVECEGQGRLLPASSLAAWGLWLDGDEENRFYLPTDEGLAVLDLNVLGLGYRLDLIPARCLAAPAALGGWLAVPALAPEGRAGVLCLAGRDGAAAWLDCEAAGDGGFAIPLARQRQVLWLGGQGQLQLGLDADRRLTARAIPWQDGDSPRLAFGSAYYARDGALWQLAYDNPAGRYHYVRLGQSQPERQPCRSPALSSGTVCFAQASQLRGPPWTDPALAYDALAEDVVIPLLEAADGAVLCVRIAWVQGLESLFASTAAHLARYELIGRDGDARFFTHRLARPWLARPFVYRGVLYLHHPELESIPGWALALAREAP